MIEMHSSVISAKTVLHSKRTLLKELFNDESRIQWEEYLQRSTIFSSSSDFARYLSLTSSKYTLCKLAQSQQRTIEAME